MLAPLLNTGGVCAEDTAQPAELALALQAATTLGPKAWEARWERS